MRTHTQYPARSEYHTQLENTSRDETFNLTAEAHLNIYSLNNDEWSGVGVGVGVGGGEQLRCGLRTAALRVV